MIAAALSLAACGGKDIDLLTSDEDARELYQRARNSMDGARFDLAIQYFQTLESRYPFSPYALQAQLDLAYTYFLYGRTERAVSEADRFIRFNPTHPNVDYAYYIRGLANFGHRPRLFSSWLPDRNPADFEREPLQTAFDDFAQLVRNFPNSPYAPDARQRMVYLRNVLAEHEIRVARFYMEKQAWVAAANRAHYVLQHFNQTSSNQEALAILVRAYRQLGLTEAADDAERVLKANYPHDPLLRQRRSLASDTAEDEEEAAIN